MGELLTKIEGAGQDALSFAIEWVAPFLISMAIALAILWYLQRRAARHTTSDEKPPETAPRVERRGIVTKGGRFRSDQTIIRGQDKAIDAEDTDSEFKDLDIG